MCFHRSNAEDIINSGRANLQQKIHRLSTVDFLEPLPGVALGPSALPRKGQSCRRKGFKLLNAYVVPHDKLTQ